MSAVRFPGDGVTVYACESPDCTAQVIPGKDGVSLADGTVFCRRCDDSMVICESIEAARANMREAGLRGTDRPAAALPPIPEMEPKVAAIVAGPKARAFYFAVLAEHRTFQLRMGRAEKVAANRAREAARWGAAEEWCDANASRLQDSDHWKREAATRDLNRFLEQVAGLAHGARESWISYWEAERLAFGTEVAPCDICDTGANGGPHQDWCAHANAEPEAKAAR